MNENEREMKMILLSLEIEQFFVEFYFTINGCTSEFLACWTHARARTFRSQCSRHTCLKISFFFLFSKGSFRAKNYIDEYNGQRAKSNWKNDLRFSSILVNDCSNKDWWLNLFIHPSIDHVVFRCLVMLNIYLNLDYTSIQSVFNAFQHITFS